MTQVIGTSSSDQLDRCGDSRILFVNECKLTVITHLANNDPVYNPWHRAVNDVVTVDWFYFKVAGQKHVSGTLTLCGVIRVLNQLVAGGSTIL